MTGPTSLTEPISLAGRVAPSRVLFGPIETNLGDGRALSSAHTAFYARRAAGGAGVIVTEIASVHESDWPYELAPLASACADGWAAVVTACRPHGTLVLAGLGHAGGQGTSAYHRRALWAPSPVIDPVTREVPAELEREEIDALVTGFAEAAQLAVDARCDGVELNAGQHSILRQFLSGLTNRRTDEYGMDRVRLLGEVLTAVRGVLGPNRVLGLRMCGDELAPWAGITPALAATLAPMLAPLLDYLVPVRGCALSVSATRPDLHTAPGFNRELCGVVRSALRRAGSGLPVALQGSVVDVAMAERALADGGADLVEMTRAQLADPDLTVLARAGLTERIRPCTLSNQHSQVRDAANAVISDDGEPDTGHEGTAPALLPARPREDVLVVGGGPAGLEAARVAALRGHQVRLLERERELGGALRLAAALPGRNRFALLVDWWRRELDRLGVRVELGVSVCPEQLAAARTDGATIWLATGSQPGPVDYEVATDSGWWRAAELLDRLLTESSAKSSGKSARKSSGEPSGKSAGKSPSEPPVESPVELPAGPAVVYDPVGGPVGVGVAELLAATGRPTAIVTPDPVVGAQLAATGGLVETNARLARLRVERITRSVPRVVKADEVELVDRHTNERRSLPASLVVDCGHRLPDDTFAALTELSGPSGPRQAGDCVAPRTLHHAVLDGRRLALGASG